MASTSKFFQLTVPAGSQEHGKILTVSSNGVLTYSSRESISGDDSWKLVPVKGSVHPNLAAPSSPELGFYIVSVRNSFSLEYSGSITAPPNSMENGEEVYALPFNDSAQDFHTVWHLSPDNEIYTVALASDGEPVRKYLWVVSDKLYVTPDQNLAEKWMYIPGIFGSGDVEDIKKEISRVDWGLIFIIGLILVLAYLILRRR